MKIAFDVHGTIDRDPKLFKLIMDFYKYNNKEKK